MARQIILCFFLVSIIGMPFSFGQKKLKKVNAKKDYVVTIKTPLGEMVILLYEDTPKHRENFVKLAHEGFYDGTKFHRVINGFMIQGGDPNSKEGGDESMIGRGGPGYTLDAEILEHHTHKKGALAAARQPDRINPEFKSSGSQFYIVHTVARTKHLNGSYTVYGEVIQGLDIVDKIAKQPVNRRRGNRPQEDIPIDVDVTVLSKKKITKLYGYKY